MEFATSTPGLLLAAAADGAGSASESQRGASLACRTALEFLEKELGGKNPPDLASKGEKLLKEAFELARKAVLAEAEKLKIAPRELASTLLLLAATRETACAIQIGDGAALLLNEKDEMVSITQPPEAEYLNETFFLVMDNALELAQPKTMPGPIKGVGLFTDGLQMLALKMPGGLPHAPFFAPLFRFVAAEASDEARTEQFERFLTSPRITQRADDDLTLLIGVLVEN